MSGRGFTVLEIAFAGAIFALLLGAATTAIATDNTAERVILAEMGPEAKTRRALRKLASELRMAGLSAEDLNANGELDEGEDINENGELDADWNLPDGTKDQATLVFNRRVEIRYKADDIKPSTVYSRKVVYRVVNKEFLREAISTDFVNNKTLVRRVVLAKGVSAVRFSRDGKVITVELDVLFPEKIFRVSKRTLSTKIFLRN